MKDNLKSKSNTKLSDDLLAIKESYDSFPYTSYPFSKSHPAHLRTSAKFLGLDAPPLEQAKILELGCAAGGNILPFAVQYPNAQVLGVDISQVHIDKGNELIKRLNITNATLTACSITDIDESFGQFDYIIAHGVYSWVTDEVRTKMLQICKQNLTANGVAYVSYNTLPGWNTLATIRDMALYHAKNFDKTEEKIMQAKSLLGFVNDAIKNSDHAYAKLMMESVNLLKNKPDYYIAHDFLELNNKPFYFSQFIEDSRSHGLQYLSDADISNMYIHNYPATISEKLSEITDVVRMEQYLDFVTNKTFRSTLLCHDSVPIDRTLNLKMARLFYYKMEITPEVEADAAVMQAGVEARFYLGDDVEKTISTENPILKAILYILSVSKKFVVYDYIIQMVVDRLPEVAKEEIEAQANLSLLDLFLRGKIKVRMDALHVQTNVTDTPEVWSYTLAQVDELTNSVVTNLHHEILRLSLIEMYLIRYLDGKNSKDQILDHLIGHVKKNDFEVNYGGKKITSDEKLKTVLSLAYMDAVERFAKNALLV